MLQSKNPTKTESWKKLSEHFKQIKGLHMKELFSKDPERFAKFSHRFQDILVDCSKNRMTDETMQLLLNLAQRSQSNRRHRENVQRREDQRNRKQIGPARCPQKPCQYADTFRRT